MKWLVALLHLVGACSGLAGVSAILLAWNESRLPFEDGRYFDGIGVHLQLGVEVGVVVAIALVIFAALSFWSARRLTRT